MIEVEIISENSSSSRSVSNALNDHQYHQNYRYYTPSTNFTRNESDSESSSTSKTTSDRKYLHQWEKTRPAMYKTYILNESGALQEKYVPWLYLKDDVMFCSLCEKYGKRTGASGKPDKRAISDTAYVYFRTAESMGSKRL